MSVDSIKINTIVLTRLFVVGWTFRTCSIDEISPILCFHVNKYFLTYAFTAGVLPNKTRYGVVCSVDTVVGVEIVGVDVHEGFGHAVVGKENHEDPVQCLSNITYVWDEGHDEHGCHSDQTWKTQNGKL